MMMTDVKGICAMSLALEILHPTIAKEAKKHC